MFALQKGDISLLDIHLMIISFSFGSRVLRREKETYM